VGVLVEVIVKVAGKLVTWKGKITTTHSSRQSSAVYWRTNTIQFAFETESKKDRMHLPGSKLVSLWPGSVLGDSTTFRRIRLV
jgi:hypothetical protein